MIVAGVLAAFNVYEVYARQEAYPFIFIVVGYLFPAGLFMLLTGIDHEVVPRPLDARARGRHAELQGTEDGAMHRDPSGRTRRSITGSFVGAALACSTAFLSSWRAKLESQTGS